MKKPITVTKKPKTCPKCGSGKILPYLYGEPSYEAFLKEQAGKLVLGGCVITGSDPKWQCRGCKTDFVKIKGEGVNRKHP